MPILIMQKDKKIYKNTRKRIVEILNESVDFWIPNKRLWAITTIATMIDKMELDVLNKMADSIVFKEYTKSDKYLYGIYYKDKFIGGISIENNIYFLNFNISSPFYFLYLSLKTTKDDRHTNLNELILRTKERFVNIFNCF